MSAVNCVYPRSDFSFSSSYRGFWSSWASFVYLPKPGADIPIAYMGAREYEMLQDDRVPAAIAPLVGSQCDSGVLHCRQCCGRARHDGE
jgi:hypothetical protein